MHLEFSLFFLPLLHQFLFLGKNTSIVLWENTLLQVKLAPRPTVDDGVTKPPKITHLDQKELDSQGQETGFPFLDKIVRLLDVIMSTLCSLNDHNLNNNL